MKKVKLIIGDNLKIVKIDQNMTILEQWEFYPAYQS